MLLGVLGGSLYPSMYLSRDCAAHPPANLSESQFLAIKRPLNKTDAQILLGS